MTNRAATAEPAPEPHHLMRQADEALARDRQACTPAEKAAAHRDILAARDALGRHEVEKGVVDLIKRSQAHPLRAGVAV